ncbi:MAG TPA: hypothetical protein VK158_01950 [Acidobacteriota bacterium]|nr:hypothetical protein [Acidobacteriota bacterium]
MAKETVKPEAKSPAKLSKDEQIGFHKGSISVLAKEREEMIRIAQITEQLMQMHMKALAELGVDLKELPAAHAPASNQPEPKKKVPIEHLI